jgi:hypothetical protein
MLDFSKKEECDKVLDAFIKETNDSLYSEIEKIRLIFYLADKVTQPFNTAGRDYLVVKLVKGLLGEDVEPEDVTFCLIRLWQRQRESF